VDLPVNYQQNHHNSSNTFKYIKPTELGYSIRATVALWASDLLIFYKYRVSTTRNPRTTRPEISGENTFRGRFEWFQSWTVEVAEKLRHVGRHLLWSWKYLQKHDIGRGRESCVRRRVVGRVERGEKVTGQITVGLVHLMGFIMKIMKRWRHQQTDM